MAVAGYNVYIDGSLVASVTGTSAHLTQSAVAALTPGSTHTAKVQAFDDAGNLSAQSSGQTFTVPAAETVGDTFPGLTLAGEQGVLALNTSGATTQTGEPAWATRSLWGEWVAPRSGRFTFDTLLDQADDPYAVLVRSMPGLEGYWRLNEGGWVAVDESGHARHGVYAFGHVETDGPLEAASRAALLDGQAQYVELPELAAFSIGATGLTIGMLVRIDDPRPANTQAGRVALAAKDGEWLVEYASLDAATDAGAVVATAAGASAAFTDADITPGWVLLFATFDPPGSAGGITLYRGNGARATSSYPASPARPLVASPPRIGHAGAGFFAGAVGEVAVWSRVLDASEIDTLNTEFEGTQTPVVFKGISAQGTATTPGDLVIPYTRDVEVGDSLLLYVGGEFQPGGNTIFDSLLSGTNDYHRVVKTQKNTSEAIKLVCYRAEITTRVPAGTMLTIRPDNPSGVRSVAVAHFEPLGNLEAGGAGFAVAAGNTQDPPATPAVRPASRNSRVISAILVQGPPDDAFVEDADFTSRVRFGTTSFDAGVPVLRTRQLFADAQATVGGVLSIPVAGSAVPAGSTILVHLAHTRTPAVAVMSDSAGNTYATDKTSVDPVNALRQTRYRAAVATSIPVGGHIDVTLPLGSYAVIAEVYTGPGATTDADSAVGTSQNTSSPPIDPTSLAGLVVATLAWDGPPSDAVTIPSGWLELARVGVASCSLLLAGPAFPVSHEVVWNPKLTTAIRDWTSIRAFYPPAVTSGGPLTPHDTNATLNVALLNIVPVGALVPYQPHLDASPDAQRRWVTMTLSFQRP